MSISSALSSFQKMPAPFKRMFTTRTTDRTEGMGGIDFFTVPTATSRILYFFMVLSHDRRQVVHSNLTEYPTGQWTAQQLVEAFPFDSAPCYLLRDRDAIYGEAVRRRIKSLGTEEAVSAPRAMAKTPPLKELFEPYAGIVWITSLFSMSNTYAERFANTSVITMPVERIRR